MPSAAAKHGYTRGEVLRLLGVSERQLRGWEKLGLVSPAAAYGFQQLIALRTLAKLRAARVPSAKIHRALDALRRKLREVKDPLSELKIYSDGNRIRVQLGSQRMEPESGQLLLNFDEAELQRLVSLPGRSREELAAAVRRKQQEAENWFHKGVDLEQSGAPVEQVIDAYRIALALDPKLAAALVNLGTIYFTLRDWDKADKHYSRALEANPNYPLAHFNMGNLCDERGDRGRALYHYLMAVRLDPQYADAYYNLALLHQGTGQLMKAMRFWRAYLKLDPSSPWADIARTELQKLYASTVVRGRGRKDDANAGEDQ